MLEAPPRTAPITPFTATIARLAHEIWCQQMAEEGWSPGDRYDEEAKVHDGMRPFDELSAFDREFLLEGVAIGAFDEQLAGAVDFSRGPAREFTPQEMRIGLRVLSEGSNPPVYGKVVSWTQNDPQSSRLDMISVKWEDGSILEHVASIGELAHVDE